MNKHLVLSSAALGFLLSITECTFLQPAALADVSSISLQVMSVKNNAVQSCDTCPEEDPLHMGNLDAFGTKSGYYNPHSAWLTTDQVDAVYWVTELGEVVPTGSERGNANGALYTSGGVQSGADDPAAIRVKTIFTTIGSGSVQLHAIRDTSSPDGPSGFTGKNEADLYLQMATFDWSKSTALNEAAKIGSFPTVIRGPGSAIGQPSMFRTTSGIAEENTDLSVALHVPPSQKAANVAIGITFTAVAN